jgi:hypothetical protein
VADRATPPVVRQHVLATLGLRRHQKGLDLKIKKHHLEFIFKKG